MAIKKYKPTTPGRRGMTVTDYSVLSKVAPERSLLEPNKKHAGRNNTGKITVRHHGGGNRTKYRVIDFKRNKFGVPATVKTLEYDPNRSAFIALVEYEDGVLVNRNDGMASIGAAQLQTEEAWLVQKFCRSLGSVQIDNQTRPCHSSTPPVLPRPLAAAP